MRGQLKARVSGGAERNESLRLATWLVRAFDRLWSDARLYRWPLILVTALAIAARIQSISNTMYSIDGYEPFPYLAMFTDGRWGLAALQWARAEIGFSGIGVVPSSLVLAAMCYAGAGFIFARCIFRRLSCAEVAIFVSLYTLHPFRSEAYTFSDMTLNGAIATFVGAAGLACCLSQNTPRFGSTFGFLLIFLALSVHQLLIAEILIIVLVAALVAMTRRDEISRPTVATLWSNRLIRAAILSIASACAYAASISLFHIVARIPFGRDDLSQVVDFEQKLVALHTALSEVFLPLTGFVTPLASALTIFVLAAAVAMIVRAIARSRGFPAVLLALAMVGAAVLCSVSIPLAAKFIWLDPRNLVPFSILLASLALVGWRFVHNPAARAVLAIIIVALNVDYVGAANRILYDQHLVNRWDMEEANRILSRLELDPHYGDLRTLAIMNAGWSRPIPLETTIDDLNISALYPPWSKIGVFEQTTGLAFAEPTTDELSIARTICSKGLYWPARGSVRIVGELGIACLGPNIPVSN